MQMPGPNWSRGPDPLQECKRCPLFEGSTVNCSIQEDGETEGGGGGPELQPPALREVREREVRAVRAAEEGRLDEALQLLNEAVAMAPDSASIYNNRAQVSSELEIPQNLVCDSGFYIMSSAL